MRCSARCAQPEDRVLRLPGDADLDFVHNGVRTFYLWRYLERHHAGDCDWFAKVDADTYLNLGALRTRLSRYFEASKPYYLGSVKTTTLGSGRSLPFALNAAVLSRGALQRDDVVFRGCVEVCGVWGGGHSG